MSEQFLLVFCIVSLFFSAFAIYRTISFEKRWASTLKSTDGRSLQNLLEEHITERRQTLSRVDTCEKRLDKLEETMTSTKRYIGVVRYDAFEDVGGEQSFALAIYDEKGDGAVITSLVGRADCRVYCKTLTRGRSERTLSQEESRAVEEAYRHASRPVIST